MIAWKSKSIVVVFVSLFLMVASWEVVGNSPEKSSQGTRYSLKIDNNTEEGFEIRVDEVEFECMDCDGDLLMRLREPKSPPEKFKEIYPQTSETESWVHYKPRKLMFRVYKEGSLLATGPKSKDEVVVDLTRDGKVSGPKYDGFYDKAGKYEDFKGKAWVDVEVKWAGNESVVVITSQLM